MRFGVSLAGLCLVIAAAQQPASRELHFAILGDRTGEAVPGVYQEAWKEIAAEKPDFVINVGDSIQGGDDATAAKEWREVKSFLAAYRRFAFFFVPGNHDVWSEESSALYQQQTSRPLHYSFDRATAHFTVLDNSRTETLPDSELTFLRDDLEAHKSQKVKFIFFHRPSWILQTLLRNPDFPLHKLAREYGVQYVVCGHIHEMLRFNLDGVEYLSLASSGGHLRDPKTYARGWFFQYSSVRVRGDDVVFEIKELQPPYGLRRVTKPADWGASGLKAGYSSN